MKLSIIIHRNAMHTALLTFFIAFGSILNSSALSITQLSGAYRQGQTFLTWTNPIGTNLQYNVYRSTTKFTSSTQLNSSTYLGYVRDNSSKNIPLSMDMGVSKYFKIDKDGQPLASNKGVYVVTCTSNQSYYYAITITELLTGIELKVILAGQTTLSSPVAETVSKPKAVLQDSIVTTQNEVKYRYVQFVNNQETTLYPAMNSTGSYGFNFYIVKRGVATSYPLIAVYENSGNTGTAGVALDGAITNCYVIGFSDWLPVPASNNVVTTGENSYWSGYHSGFNIYSNNFPTPVSGTVKLYTVKRFIEAIRWAKTEFPIDGSRVYTKGVSNTGFGALLTALVYPNEIAAVYSQVDPMIIKPYGSKAELYKAMWGASSTALLSDAINPKTQTGIPIYTILDLKKMLDVDENTNLPLIFDVHGKKDKTVAWGTSVIDWLDSLTGNHVGGVFYWDQRSHDGDGKNFLPEETTPDFYRYQTTKSYPAFSNCSIDQNPGTGLASSGAPYGAINGYLDWDDQITDNTCNYSIDVFVKNFYVGGVLHPDQYSTCTTDISFRRLQNFHPSTGVTIKWKNFNSVNAAIQSGSFVYNGGLITLTGLTVNKSGNRIELTILNCQKDEGVTKNFDQHIYFSRNMNGYTAHADLNEEQQLVINTYDLLGRNVRQQTLFAHSGSNTFDIPSPGPGMYLVEIKGTSFSSVNKLVF